MASDTSTKSKTSSTQKVAEARTRLAQVVEVACTLIAALLVLAAILVAVRGSINTDNPLVELVRNIAKTFDGPFDRKDGVFSFGSSKSDITYEALTNWGLAALVYLVAGRVLGRVIRP